MDRQRAKSDPGSWEALAALCCFSGGMFAALIGSVLTAVTWFLDGALHPWLRGAGTVFLIATIPLLIFSGYCLDWAEGKKGSLERVNTAAHIKKETQ